MAKFKCINLECNKHCQEIDYVRYKSMIKHGDHIFMDKNHNQIVCSECGEPLKFIEPKHDGFPQVRTQTFHSLSNHEKREVLKKRQSLYDKKDKQTKEYKEAINRGEIKQ